MKPLTTLRISMLVFVLLLAACSPATLDRIISITNNAPAVIGLAPDSKGGKIFAEASRALIAFKADGSPQSWQRVVAAFAQINLADLGVPSDKVQLAQRIIAGIHLVFDSLQGPGQSDQALPDFSKIDKQALRQLERDVSK